MTNPESPERPIPLPDTERPLIIFGFGGSATRLAAQIAEKCGYRMGPYHPDTYDWKPLFTWDFDPYKLRGLAQDCRWGFKNPWGIVYLKFLHLTFPSGRFWYITRDGRDMAYSRNRGIFNKLSEIHGFTGERNKRFAQAQVWAKLSGEALDFAEKYGLNYHVTRMESLLKKEGVEGGLWEFLDAKPCDWESLVQGNGGSVGRWEGKPMAERQAIAIHVRDVNRRLGYVV